MIDGNEDNAGGAVKLKLARAAQKQRGNWVVMEKLLVRKAHGGEGGGASLSH